MKKNISNNEQITKYIKKQFSRIDNTSAKKLSNIILKNQQIEIEVRDFKEKYESFVERNKIRFIPSQDGTKHYLKQDFITNLKQELIKILKDIGASIQYIEDDKDDKWSKSQINGVEVYEVNKHTTFQQLREKVDEEGKDAMFRYSFKKPDLKTGRYENINNLQMIDVHINDNGEYFGFPLKYTYNCPECGHSFEKMEHEVSSTGNKFKCENILESQNNKGEPTFKRCNTPLSPDINQTETKDSYIHNISFIDQENKTQKAEAITFINLPKGYLRVVLLKIPRPYDQQLVFIVDYEPIEREELPIPEKKEDEHYIFTLIKSIDAYIEKMTGYEHFGFLPMKISMILQLMSRYNEAFKNNFHISLSGEMSSGKSQFARYWGLCLYSQNCWSSNATSISIPKLRGTMESFHLFGKDHRYQYRGLLGEIDLLIIDEVKENMEVKNNLKQYLLEGTYEYSKAGSNNQTYPRTAQAIVTQNIDTKHLDRYSKAVREQYMNTMMNAPDSEQKKPPWDPTIDLTLPLFEYNKNPYLKYSIKKVRELYEKNQINWIDGSELALKQRFYFYYYLGSTKKSKELTRVIRKNNTRKIISNNIEIMRILSSNNLKQKFKESIKLTKGKNDLEYFEKVDKILEVYGKRTDARTQEMSYNIMQMLRMIDEREYCTDKDLEILTYIIENVDNKTEVANTNTYQIRGVKDVNIDDNFKHNEINEIGEEDSIFNIDEET
ncbi:MAG: hypothetical protein ACOCP8_01095 [archaeon]